jgi:hypothetical protein
MLPCLLHDFFSSLLKLPDPIFAKSLFEIHPALYDLMVIPVFIAFKAP